MTRLTSAPRDVFASLNVGSWLRVILKRQTPISQISLIDAVTTKTESLSANDG